MRDNDDSYYSETDSYDSSSQDSGSDSYSEPYRSPEPAGYADQPDPSQPAPLVGCLVCFAEGTIQLIEKPAFFNFKGFRVGVPLIVCQKCGSTAQFELGADADSWRVRYKRVNHPERYHYAARTLGVNRWLSADEALEMAERGYMQRMRLEQVANGDLSFLPHLPTRNTSSLLSPDETVYTRIEQVALQVRGRETSLLDNGVFYLTDQKVHLHGARRDWSHRLSDLHIADFNTEHWQIEIGATPHTYVGSSRPTDPDALDAQLLTALVRTLSNAPRAY